MGIFAAKYTYKGKTVSGYKIYCGQRSDGRKIVKWAKTLKEAREIETVYKRRRSQVDAELLALPATAKVEILNVIKKCALAQTSLSDIYNYWANDQFSAGSKTVQECSELYLQSLAHSGRKKLYISKMRLFLLHLCESIGSAQIHAVKLADLEALANKISLKTRPTWRKCACSFWSWSVKKGFCSQNIATRLDTPSVELEVPQVLSVDQCRQLLARCSDAALPGLVLMLFAGIRPLEAVKVSWRDVDFDAKTITINASVAKTRSFRKVSMTENLLAWMRYLKERKVILPIHRKGKPLTSELARILGLSVWPRDSLRHTAASMMLERTQSADRTALELGNSPGILHRHYKNLVSSENCRIFWDILPSVRIRTSEESTEV